MLQLKEYTQRIDEAREFLEEKLIQYNNGKKYGQVVFIAGGAGSGKGFAIKQFMESEKFKVRDVDEMKSAFLKLDKLTGKYPEIRGLDLRKPDDVFKLHDFVDKKGVKDRTLKNLLLNKDPRRLPNIIFDITAKNIKSITKVIPLLEKVGYKSRDIHMTWVLTDYKVAMKNNAGRDRVVPEDILMRTHVGAANTMTQIIAKNAIPRSLIDGGVYVVLNNRENTIVYSDEEKAKSADKNNKTFHVKSFSYLTLKKPGKPMESKDSVLAELGTWITKNAPSDFVKRQKEYDEADAAEKAKKAKK